MADTENPSPDMAKPGLLEDWITRAELALELGLSVDTLARWETRRIGPTCVQIGRKVIYRRGAIQELLNEQERPRFGFGGRK